MSDDIEQDVRRLLQMGDHGVSRLGLIDLLQRQGHSEVASRTTVDSMLIDFVEQAVNSARWHHELDECHFSPLDLFGLLVQSEQFTPREAASAIFIVMGPEILKDDHGSGGKDWFQAGREARAYLASESFSRFGLIEQLRFDGFSLRDAEEAADALLVDWSEEAAKSAKWFLDEGGYSKVGLIKQLELEGFSTVEARAGLESLNVDWVQQAIQLLKKMRRSVGDSQTDAVELLEAHGFSSEQAMKAFGAS